MLNTLQANPFVLLMDPATVIQAMERSERLATLNSRICRPLDRPLIARVSPCEADAFDREVDLDDTEVIADAASPTNLD